jgi:membrane fusion protein (multidrug efflux system)
LAVSCLDAIPDSAYEGKVYAIDPAYDPNGRAIILRARLPNRDGMLRSGMFARVTLLVEERQEAIVVPETALVPVGQDQFIFRVVDGKALLTKVRIGQRRRGQVEVTEGLARDAVIVTEGAVKLRDGAAVRTAAPRAS